MYPNLFSAMFWDALSRFWNGLNRKAGTGTGKVSAETDLILFPTEEARMAIAAVDGGVRDFIFIYWRCIVSCVDVGY